MEENTKDGISEVLLNRLYRLGKLDNSDFFKKCPKCDSEKIWSKFVCYFVDTEDVDETSQIDAEKYVCACFDCGMMKYEVIYPKPEHINPTA